MSKRSSSYKQSVDRFARRLAKADWSFDSITGSFVPGASGEVPIPLPPEVLSPYKSLSVQDGIVSYDVTKLGTDLFDFDITYLGSGQIRIDVDYPIPGLASPYDTKHLLGTVTLKPGKNGSYRRPSAFSIAAQTIADGDGTTGMWQVTGQSGDPFFVAVGRETGAGGFLENIEALVSAASPIF